MITSFIEQVSKETLAELIIWYVKHGHCTISQELICRQPVRLVPNPEQNVGSNSESSDAEDEDEDEKSSNLNVVISSVSAETYSKQKNASHHIYEATQIQDWFQTSGKKSDPITRAKVADVISIIDQLDYNVQNQDILHTVSHFIKFYLTVLQQHVQQGNIAEVQYWLEAWTLAKEMYNDPNCKLRDSEDLNLTLEALAELNIKLQCGKSIATVAYESKQTKLLELLTTQYHMTYTISAFKAYINLIDHIQEQPKSSIEECTSAFFSYMHDVFTQTKPHTFLNSPIIDSISHEDYDDNHKAFFKFKPLQIAVICQLPNLVTSLLNMGAQLSECSLTILEVRCITLKKLQLLNNHLKCEIFLAVDTNREDLLLRFREIVSARHPLLLHKFFTPYVIYSGSTALIKTFFENFDVALSFDGIMDFAQADDVSPAFITYLCQNVLLTESIDLETVWQIFNNLHENSFLQNHKYDTDLFNLAKNSYISLLSYGSPKYVCEDHSYLDLDQQTKVYHSIQALALAENIYVQRNKYEVLGQVKQSFLSDASFERELYIGIYANYELIKDLGGYTQRNRFIQYMAKGNISHGDFSPVGIKRRMQEFVSINNTPVLFSQANSTADNEAQAENNELSIKRHKATIS